MGLNLGLDLGSVIGAGVGAFASNATSSKQFKYQRALQEHAALLNYQYSQKTAENSPTWNRTGLEAAGYNPMLAVQNATSGANSSFTSAGNATGADYASAISQGVSNAVSIQEAKNNTAQTESNVQLNDAQARNAIQDAIGKEIHNKYLDENEQKQLKKLDAETAQLTADANHKTALIDAIDKNIELQREIAYLQSFTGINIANIGANATTKAAQIGADASIENTESTNRTKLMGQGIGSLSTLLGFGLGGYWAKGVAAPLLKGAPDLIKVVPKFIKFH